VHFNDKDVHQIQSPGCPVLTILGSAMARWVELKNSLLSKLAFCEHPELVAISKKLLAAPYYCTNGCSVFKLLKFGAVESIGSRTWLDALPNDLRLVPNFARHFWPTVLADHKVPQSCVDILMRHQMASQHPGGSSNVRIPTRQLHFLKSAMEAEISKLGLVTPAIFGGEG
jgi:hypothetical protein